MAQSKVDAQAFKDDYTKGVIDGAVQQRIADKTEMAFSSMPEQNLGDQAAIVWDLNRNDMVHMANGDPHTYVVKNGRYHKWHNPGAAYPVEGVMPMNQYQKNLGESIMRDALDLGTTGRW